MYIMQYVTRIKKHSHNQIRKAIIEIESNRKEYESLHPLYCERWSFSKGRGEFGSKVKGMIKQMGVKIKTPKKIPGPKLNPKNFLTKFSSLKIFQKALNDIIITFYFIWLYFIRRITQPTIFRLFRIPPKIPS